VGRPSATAAALLLGVGLGMSTMVTGTDPTPQMEVICFESTGIQDKPMPDFCVFSSTRVPSTVKDITKTENGIIVNLVVSQAAQRAVADLCMASRETLPETEIGSYIGHITGSDQTSTCLAGPQTMRAIVGVLSDDFTSQGWPLPSLLDVLQRRLGMRK